jgi:hypothetical protein
VEFTGAERALVVEQHGHLKLLEGGYGGHGPLCGIRTQSQLRTGAGVR